MDIGARIRFFREKEGITVNKLANKSGVSQSYLRDIELGNKQPTVEYLEYICYGLNITLSDFFDTKDDLSELEYAIKELTDKQKRLLAELIISFKK